MSAEVNSFFAKYDEANRSSDSTGFRHLYAERFMFARANELNVVERESFLKVLPHMKTSLWSMGLSEVSVKSVETHTLDSHHLMAKVGWRTNVRSSSGTKAIDIFATFILARGAEDTLSIVFQLDHQDLFVLIRSVQ